MVKDLFAIAGRKVSVGNPDWYEAAVAGEETAPALLRLLDAGATLTGITICDEFFYSVLGTNAHYGTPVNTEALRHVTGGSSCGSAAAVAASMCDFALGSDTGGSIRVPAAFAASMGCAPPTAASTLKGVTPMAPSYDTVGFTRPRREAFPRGRPRAAERRTRRCASATPDHLPKTWSRAPEASIDEEIWRVLHRIDARCPCRSTWMWWAKSSTPGAMAFASIKASSCSRR